MFRDIQKCGAKTYRNVEQRVDVLESECLGGECICGCSGIWDDADIDILSTPLQTRQRASSSRALACLRGPSIFVNISAGFSLPDMKRISMFFLVTCSRV